MSYNDIPEEPIINEIKVVLVLAQNIGLSTRL